MAPLDRDDLDGTRVLARAALRRDRPLGPDLRQQPAHSVTKDRWAAASPAFDQHAARQVLTLQASYGNRAVGSMLQRQTPPDRPPPEVGEVAIKQTPATKGLWSRLKKSLAARLLAATLESKGAKTEVRDGSTVRTPEKQQIERRAGEARPPKGRIGGGIARGGGAVVNVVNVLTLADDFHNIGKGRRQVQLEGLSADDFSVGHEFKDVPIPLGKGVSGYGTIRVERNIVGRKKFYLVKVDLGQA